jgi:hypothetical protein
MLPDPLIDAGIRLVLALELASNDVVDPDFAVRLLEDIAHSFSKLTDSERERIALYVLRYAATAEGLTENERAAIRRMPGELGAVP